MNHFFVIVVLSLSWLASLANCLLPVGHFEIACGFNKNCNNEKLTLDFPNDTLDWETIKFFGNSIM